MKLSTTGCIRSIMWSCRCLVCQVLKAWKEAKGVQDGKALRKQIFGVGVSVVTLAVVQLVIDIIASYCTAQTAEAVGSQPVAGSSILALFLQVLSIYFAINAGAPLRLDDPIILKQQCKGVHWWCGCFMGCC
jgi:hypothetical protein